MAPTLYPTSAWRAVFPWVAAEVWALDSVALMANVHSKPADRQQRVKGQCLHAILTPMIHFCLHKSALGSHVPTRRRACVLESCLIPGFCRQRGKGPDKTQHIFTPLWSIGRLVALSWYFITYVMGCDLLQLAVNEEAGSWSSTSSIFIFGCSSILFYNLWRYNKAVALWSVPATTEAHCCHTRNRLEQVSATC